MTEVSQPDTAPRVRDGRSERRERGRAAVIEAVFDLLQEGHATLSAEAIGDRSGVSLSSLFRYFDSLEDLHRDAIETHFARHAALFEVPALGEGPLVDRIRHLVDARLTLYEAIAPVARLARAKAHQHLPLADSLHQTRRQMTAQVRTHFAAELADRSPAAAQDLIDTVATLSSFESWDLLTGSAGRTRHQIRRLWLTALRGLLSTR